MDNAAPTKSKCTRWLGHLGDVAQPDQDDADDDHLADEGPPPRGKAVTAPPTRGPTAMATAPAAATRPYAAARFSRPTFAATSATTAGKISAASRPSRNDQPSRRTPRWGRER
jgi:hypothetical protein